MIVGDCRRGPLNQGLRHCLKRKFSCILPYKSAMKIILVTVVLEFTFEFALTLGVPNLDPNCGT